MFNWFYNLKIQKKLYVGFGCVIVLSIILGIIGIRNMKNIDTKYTQLLDGPVGGAQMSAEMGREYAVARRQLLMAAYMSDDPEAVRIAFSNFDKSINNVITLIKEEIVEIENDPSISQTEMDEVIAMMNGLLAKVSVDYVGARNEMEAEIREGDSDGDGKLLGLRDIINEASIIAEDINGNIDMFIQITSEAVDKTSEQTTIDVNRNILFITILAIFTVLLSIVSALIIGRVIRKPILKLAEVARKNVDGNFNISVRSNGKDEVADLSNMFGDVIDMFLLLVDKINESHEKLMRGELDVAINEELFPGDYKKAVSAVNDTVNYLAGNTFLTIKCVEDYGKGNFDTTIRRFPGPQAILHEVLDSLQSNLKLVNQEINSLIKNAIEGNLETRIDINNYEGDWRKIASGLNDLMKAVQNPIAEVSNVLEQVAAANFDVSIHGEYKGQFNIMKNSVNKTVQNTAEYISDISSILEKMSDQDLNINITKEYIGDFKIIKNALIRITDTFNMMIGEINSSAEQVARGADQIAQSSSSLAEGSAEQANSVEELDATIELIAKQTSDNTKNLLVANDLSIETKNSGIVSKKEMEVMLKSMSDIEDASSDISKIIKVIDDIAFQTNLLALNAAVEAARAGEHGKGFAVVAEEVRNLVGRSQKASSETTELIKKTAGLVSNGTKAANRTADSLNKIVEQITEITTLIESVANASKEEDIAISQITEGIRQIAHVTQANTSMSEESATAAQELSSQSEVLKSVISKFKLRYGII